MDGILHERVSGFLFEVKSGIVERGFKSTNAVGTSRVRVFNVALLVDYCLNNFGLQIARGRADDFHLDVSNAKGLFRGHRVEDGLKFLLTSTKSNTKTCSIG